MDKQSNGFVIYCKDGQKASPYGVVCDDYECKADSIYIPKSLKEYLVRIEDKRFFEHNGIDFKSIVRASLENLKAGKIVQGGSTITQQLARNILKDNRKSFSRKIRETIKALQLESKFTKDEILNLYFDNVYFGKNLRGIRAASLYYFGKEVENLTQPQILYLLTILRGPNYYINNPLKTIKRYEFLNNTFLESNLISNNRYHKNAQSKIQVGENYLFNVKNEAIPFITETTNLKKKRITSTIDIKIQEFARQFVTDSKYPISIIAIKKGKVVGFASSYGNDYPFISKSNVGSTLKPFIYCHLRENGISKKEKFNAYINELNINIREAGYYSSKLSIEQALLYSNNNVFINASNKIGIDSTLKKLSDTLGNKDNLFFISSILGSTKKGISLYELASAYSSFFSNSQTNDIKKECLLILNKIFTDKLGFTVENAFLKTGTTNNNKERYVVLGNPDITYAVLRNENYINDSSKEGNFMKQIKKSFFSFFESQKNYKWI